MPTGTRKCYVFYTMCMYSRYFYVQWVTEFPHILTELFVALQTAGCSCTRYEILVQDVFS